MSIKRLFDAVERRGDIGRRVAALVLPISNRPRMTSSCAGKIGLREPGEHTSRPNLASRDNVAHNPTLYTILETPPPVMMLCQKQPLQEGRHIGSPVAETVELVKPLHAQWPSSDEPRAQSRGQNHKPAVSCGWLSEESRR
jgi:hypothetical protein